MPNINADTLVQLLAQRHKDDVFVAECKNGSTWYDNHLRLDGWAMPKSWVNSYSIGYEIKMSREDFLSDRKWQGYLPLCHELYFVCPYGLIKPEELPPEVGVIWASTNYARLFTKKKAVRRLIDWPVDLLLYILIARTKVRNKFERDDPVDQTDYWRAWLQRAKDASDLGAAVSKKLREIVNDEVFKVRAQNKELQARISRFERLQHRLDELEIGSSFYDVDHIVSLINQRDKFWTRERVQAVDAALEALMHVRREMQVRPKLTWRGEQFVRRVTCSERTSR